MDSDDEAFLENFEFITQQRFSGIHFEPTSLELKLYQMEEHDALNVLYWDAFDAGFAKELDWKDDFSSYFRLKRFFDSIKGFFEGNLDLTGRHQYRYQSLLNQWNRFLPDVLELARHATKSEQPISVGTRELDVDPLVQTFYTVDPPELWEDFANKWKVHKLPLSLILGKTRGLVDYLRSHTKPKFQKQLLEDLPPELLHEILGMLDCKDSRRLGATSRYLRTFALLRMYRVQHFDLRLEFDPSIYLPLQLENPERMSTLGEKARAVLLQRLSACSLPDIARTMETISIFGIDFDHLYHAAGFDIGGPSYLEFFSPIGMQASGLIKETTKLKEISLSRFFFAEDFAQALLSLPCLHTIRVSNCFLAPFPDPPQCKSLLNLFLDIDDDSEDSGLTQWNILKSCANLQFLYISIQPGMIKIDPGPAFREACNPFGSLKKLILKGFDCEDIDLLGTWSSGSSTRLTHLKLQLCAYNYGITFEEIDCLMDAFRGSPLEVLVLEGLHYAHPDILDLISITFPTLRSLTLLYLQSPRQVRIESVYWPYFSWEYAPHFANFSYLEHFGWNFAVNDLEDNFPQTLLGFEDGFTKCLSEEEFAELDGQSLADRDSIARVLAAFCPTLKEVAFHPVGFPDCKISRTPSGVIEVTGGEDLYITASQTRREALAEDETMWQVFPRYRPY